MSLLKRFWFKFEKLRQPTALNFGCGITAYGYNDAMRLLREQVFRAEPMPEILEVSQDIDVSTLDSGHVLPNIGSVVNRGVWFPRL